MDRRVLFGGLIALVLALIGLGVLIAKDTTVEPVEPKPLAEVPLPAAAAKPMSVRHTLRPPADVPRPEFPADRPPAAQLTPDDRKAMNYAVDFVLREARDACILPWLDSFEERVTAELVLDAVLYDGQLYDVGLRSLTRDMPAEVVDCVADKAWYGDWPTWELQGELRLQRHVEYHNDAPLTGP